jgi:hypothetical protein
MARKPISAKQEVLFADPAQVAEDVKDMPLAFLDCRDMQHAWIRSHVTQVQGAPIIERVRRCTRCKTEFVEDISKATGEVIGKQYRYADGYLMPAGYGRIVGAAKGQLRLFSLASWPSEPAARKRRTGSDNGG